MKYRVQTEDNKKICIVDGIKDGINENGDWEIWSNDDKYIVAEIPHKLEVVKLCDSKVECEKSLSECLVGEYLRGFCKRDGWEHIVYVVFGSDDNKKCLRCSYDEDDGYRDSHWEFNFVEGIPDLDNTYKVIGERVKDVIVNGENSEEKTIIKTDTRVLDFTTQYFDSYYPCSIWKFI